MNAATKVTQNHLYLHPSSDLTAMDTIVGELAQLARALAWHARGRRFDSDILHTGNQGFAIQRKAFFLSGNTWVTHHPFIDLNTTR